MSSIPLALDAQMFLRLLTAVVLGALVGYERERAGKPAGVRTHGMVSLGAALFTVVSLHGFEESSDPARVAAQIVDERFLHDFVHDVLLVRAYNRMMQFLAEPIAQTPDRLCPPTCSLVCAWCCADDRLSNRTLSSFGAARTVTDSLSLLRVQ